MFIGMSRRNIIGLGIDGDKMIGGLTPGNLSKIGGENAASRVASAIDGVQLPSHRVSQEELGSEASPATK